MRVGPVAPRTHRTLTALLEREGPPGAAKAYSHVALVLVSAVLAIRGVIASESGGGQGASHEMSADVGSHRLTLD